MCGIAGILDAGGRPVDLEVLTRMCNALRHRGPDDSGHYIKDGIGLGHRRLSIIDISSGHQPLSNEDGSVWIVFNGEIYNFKDLRSELESLGHSFSTHSDTEVIVHAYEEYGEACVTRLRGMFAFAIWDERKRRLFLARDRVGKKPLFYALAGNQWIFASELQGLLSHPDLCQDQDPAAIDDYLTYGYIPAPRTAYKRVLKLPPGHHLTIDLPETSRGQAVVRTGRYWRLAYGPKDKLSEGDALEGFLEVLTEAVKIRLISEVPLGALLSGGMDSGVVVALMSRLSDRPVKTFSIGFEEQAFNELPHARRVAEMYGTEHHELIVRSNSMDALPLLIRHYGEPFADSSAIPSFNVARLTREHVTVALNGDGGDESLAGYERYIASNMADRYKLIPAFLRRALAEPIASLVPETLPRNHRLRQAKHFVSVASQRFDQRYLRWVSLLDRSQKSVMYTESFKEQLGAHDGGSWLTDEMAAFQRTGMGHLDTMLAVDVDSYLPYDLLVKMDIAAMASSLEARSPFLDHKVMEFCARLPDSLKIRGGKLKYLLRKASETLLPRENVARRKMGFGIPVGDWMRGELRPLLEDLLLARDARVHDYMAPEPLRRMIHEHLNRQYDYTAQLWGILWLEMWRREASG